MANVSQPRKDSIADCMIKHLDLRRRFVLAVEGLEDVLRVSNPGERAHDLAANALRKLGQIERDIYEGSGHDDTVQHSVSQQRYEPKKSLR